MSPEIISKIKEILNRPIAFHRAFIKLTGSVNGALMLSQAWYWQPKSSQDDGWWYKTHDQWEQETGMNRIEVDAARKHCAAYLEHKIGGIPAKSYYRLNEELVIAVLFGEQKPIPGKQKRVLKSKFADGQQTGEDCEQACRPPATQFADGQQPSIGAESKAESNKEIVATAPVPVITPFKLFVDMWHQEFEKEFKFKYSFKGSRDGVAVKELLTSCNPNQLIDIARAAWVISREGKYSVSKNNCRTLFKFNAAFNDIRAEIADRQAPKKLDPQKTVYVTPTAPPKPEDMLTQRELDDLSVHSFAIKKLQDDGYVDRTDRHWLIKPITLIEYRKRLAEGEEIDQKAREERWRREGCYPEGI